MSLSTKRQSLGARHDDRREVIETQEGVIRCANTVHEAHDMMTDERSLKRIRPTPITTDVGMRRTT